MVNYLIGMLMIALSTSSTAMAEQQFDCTPSPEHHCLMPGKIPLFDEGAYTDWQHEIRDKEHLYNTEQKYALDKWLYEHGFRQVFKMYMKPYTYSEDCTLTNQCFQNLVITTERVY